MTIPKSGGGWFSKEDPLMCNNVKLSSFHYHTGDLKLANHKELRKNGLLMHLQNVRGVLVGEKSMSDPVSCIEVACAAYFSLHKYCLCFKGTFGYLGVHDWEFHETAKVQFVWICVHTYLCIFT